MKRLLQRRGYYEIDRPWRAKKASKDMSLLLAEYNALRNEILKRMDIENQLLTFTVIVFGTILGVGFQNKNAFLVLLYPALSVFFAIGWAHSDYMTRLIGRYLKTHVEAAVGIDDLGWEHYLDLNRPPLYSWTARGVFIVTELIAITVGLSLAPFNTTFIALLLRQPIIDPNIIVNIILCIALICLALTFFMLRKISIKALQIPTKIIQADIKISHK